MKAQVRLDQRDFSIDLARPVSLALELDFSGSEPRHFGAPGAASRPLAMEGFSGAVATGASCNCRTITLTPHCNGTHTECVGHLTQEPMDAHRVVPSDFQPALVCTVQAVSAGVSRESTDPVPRPEDLLVTREQIEQHWPASQPFAPRAIVLRVRAGAARMPPFFTREAMQGLVEKGIDHLLVDLPSVDRMQDEGRLTAHRVFFGLPPGSTRLSQATRGASTITELVAVPDDLEDGWCLLQLQVPAIGGDAVPSRPLVYRLL